MQLSTGENLRMAMTAVWSHRFRSLLTVLGIVIGITTVVTVASLMTGLRKGIVDFFEEFGPDNVFVAKMSGGPGSDGARAKERKRKPILPEYADAIKRLAPAVEEVGISLFTPGFANGQPLTARVRGFEVENVTLVGTSPSSFTVQTRELRAGRVFTTEEAARGDRVAVLGASLASTLFPDGNAVGHTFIVQGAEYMVLGVFAPAKGGFFGENPLDNQMTIPLRTAHLRYPQVDNYFLTAKARRGMRQEAFDEIQSILRKIRHTPRGEVNDFNLSTADQIVQQFDSVTGMIVLISIALSGLGLLVGGIGVMNIMLVSVTERTREIGIRKAIGARRFDIVTQFLMEAIALTGLGGVLGIIFAVCVTLLVSVLVPSLPSQVPLWAIATGFTVSVFVGLFFGVWPAVKASRLDPVEALRYE